MVAVHHMPAAHHLLAVREALAVRHTMVMTVPVTGESLLLFFFFSTHSFLFYLGSVMPSLLTVELCSPS
jgi:hypothetical protein